MTTSTKTSVIKVQIKQISSSNLNTDNLQVAPITENKLKLDEALLPSSLAINEDYKFMVEQKLSSKQRVIDRETVLNEIINISNNQFELFYLIDKHQSEFTHPSLLACIRKLSKLIKESKNGDLSNEFTIVPTKIKSSITKLLIKWMPYLESYESMSMYLNLSTLGFGLNDYAYAAVMQIMKHQVNSYDLRQLVSIKKKIVENRRSKQTSEYIENLDKAVSLAVQINLNRIEDVKMANSVIQYFGDSISEANYAKLSKLVSEDYKVINHKQTNVNVVYKDKTPSIFDI